MLNITGRKMKTSLKNKIKYWFHKVTHTMYSIYMCVRFPFLYPRNRFTGLHYNNWTIHDKIKDLVNEAYNFGGADEDFKMTVKNRLKWIQYKSLKWFHDVFLQIIFCIPDYCELDFMDNGWKKCFGLQMCKEIKKALLDVGGYKMLYHYRIMDIKEKYGSLVWSDNGAPEEVNKIIAKYEYISARTCINCGKTADGLTRGYILPYCKNCEDINNMDLYYTEEMPFYGHYKISVKKDTSVN